MTMAPKSTAILSAILVILFAHLVIASLTASPTSFTFVVPDEVPGATVTVNNLILTNDAHLTKNITSLDFNFVPNSSFLNNPVTTSSFSILDLDGFNGSTKTISFDFKMPEGIPAIDVNDEDFKHVIWEVGKLNLSGLQNDGTTAAFEIPIKIEVKNSLGFYKDKIELEIGGADPINVSDGDTKTPAINEDLEINVRYENSYNKDGFSFDKDDVNATLFIKGDIIYTVAGEDNVDDGEVGIMSFSFDLSDYEVDDKLDVRIELKGTDNYGSLHGEVFEFKLDIQEEAEDTTVDNVGDEDDDGVNDDVDLCPSTPPGCIVEVDGCQIDFDGDGIKDCSGSFNKNNKKEDTTEKNDNTNTVSKQKTNDKKQETKDTTEPVVKPATGDQGAMSFVFGLIVGAVGTALFFILTKV